MQVLRLLAARRLRRAVSTISAPAASCEAPEHSEADDDEGPFFDLDFASVRASSTSSSGSEDSDDACSDFDFVISLHRSRSASPSYEALYLAPPPPPPPLKLCASEARAAQLQHGGAKRAGNTLRTLSFGARKAAFYGGRPSFARSSSSARSLRLFMESPADDDEEEQAAEPRRAPPSRDVIRRCLTKISRRFRSVRPLATAAAAAEGRGLRRLRKSLSASAAVTVAASGSARRDDSLAEKQDGIAGAIAHCKESLHRASLSECDSSLLRSRSDPGKCEAA
ncbi:hypothetical protein ACP70R_039426 [Stipagrostis hirtigluma subsp. patula]